MSIFTVAQHLFTVYNIFLPFHNIISNNSSDHFIEFYFILYNFDLVRIKFFPVKKLICIFCVVHVVDVGETCDVVVLKERFWI